LIDATYQNYKKSYRKKSDKYVDGLFKRAKEMQEMKTSDVIQKYSNLYSDVKYVHTTFEGIRSDIEGEIQLQIDLARGK